jgi:hypothetical protein
MMLGKIMKEPKRPKTYGRGSRGRLVLPDTRPGVLLSIDPHHMRLGKVGIKLTLIPVARMRRISASKALEMLQYQEQLNRHRERSQLKKLQEVIPGCPRYHR